MTTVYQIKTQPTRIYAEPEAQLLSSRFQVARFAVSPQVIASPSADYVIWNEIPDWDDIGFDPTEYTGESGRFFFTAAGEYHIDAFVQLDPPSGDGLGTALISIETGGSGDPNNSVNEQMSAPLSTDIDANLSVSGTHRFYAGGQMQIVIELENADGPRIVNWASLSITKLRSIPPL